MNTEPVVIKAAKKAHRCTWCSEKVKPGESYMRWRAFDGSDAWTIKMHPECDKASQRMARQEGYDFEYMPGDFNRGCMCERGDPHCKCHPTPKEAA